METNTLQDFQIPTSSPLQASPTIAEAEYLHSGRCYMWQASELREKPELVAAWEREYNTLHQGHWKPEPIIPRNSLPAGHRFFRECSRETYARFIEWGMWVGHPQPDVWFASFTFKTFIQSPKAWSILVTWIGRLKQAYGNNRSEWLRWICAIEWQIRDVIHFHLLISGAGLSELSRERWKVRWETGDRNAGICRIHDANRKAAPYLAKYMHKGGELIQGGYWRGLKNPGSLACCQPSPIIQQSVESNRAFQAVR